MPCNVRAVVDALGQERMTAFDYVMSNGGAAFDGSSQQQEQEQQQQQQVAAATSNASSEVRGAGPAYDAKAAACPVPHSADPV